MRTCIIRFIIANANIELLGTTCDHKINDILSKMTIFILNF